MEMKKTGQRSVLVTTQASLLKMTTELQSNWVIYQQYTDPPKTGKEKFEAKG